MEKDFTRVIETLSDLHNCAKPKSNFFTNKNFKKLCKEEVILNSHSNQ